MGISFPTRFLFFHSLKKHEKWFSRYFISYLKKISLIFIFLIFVYFLDFSNILLLSCSHIFSINFSFHFQLLWEGKKWRKTENLKKKHEIKVIKSFFSMFCFCFSFHKFLAFVLIFPFALFLLLNVVLRFPHVV